LEVQGEIQSLQGSGKKEGGLYDDQIEGVMDNYKKRF
jgi:hypothetical protein